MEKEWVDYFRRCCYVERGTHICLQRSSAKYKVFGIFSVLSYRPKELWLYFVLSQLEQENAFKSLAHGLNHSKCSVC